MQNFTTHLVTLTKKLAELGDIAVRHAQALHVRAEVRRNGLLLLELARHPRRSVAVQFDAVTPWS